MNFSTSHSFLGQRNSFLRDRGLPLGPVRDRELLRVALHVLEDQLLFVGVLRERERNAPRALPRVLLAAQPLLVHLPRARLVQRLADRVAPELRFLLAQADPVRQLRVLVALLLLLVALDRQLELFVREQVCGGWSTERTGLHSATIEVININLGAFPRSRGTPWQTLRGLAGRRWPDWLAGGRPEEIKLNRRSGASLIIYNSTKDKIFSKNIFLLSLYK